MLCDICKKNEATYHTITTINGVSSQAHLCAECRKKLLLSGETNGSSFSPSLFSAFSSAPVRRRRIVCPVCGLTEEEYNRTGYLGCERCYEVFAPLLTPRIARIQDGEEHIGKRPLSVGDEVKSARDEYASLQAELKKAVDEEEYELASKIKKKLQELRRSAGGEIL